MPWLTDAHRHLMFHRAALEGGEKLIEISEEQVACPRKLDVEGRIQHIR